MSLKINVIKKRYKAFGSAIIKKVSMLIVLFLTVNCSEKEPDFIIKGNPTVTKDIKVNIEMFKETGKRISTAYYDGKSYAIDNSNVMRYRIYVSYQNKYFGNIEMDNLHQKLKGKAVNEIVLVKKNDVITAFYIGVSGKKMNTGIELLPGDIFFTDEHTRIEEKEKFTAFYNN